MILKGSKKIKHRDKQKESTQDKDILMVNLRDKKIGSKNKDTKKKIYRKTQKINLYGGSKIRTKITRHHEHKNHGSGDEGDGQKEKKKRCLI